MDQPQHPKLVQVVDILQHQGYSEDQIAQILADLTRASYEKLYSQALLVLTDEDLEKIEKVSDDQMADEIRYFYKLRTGMDPEQEAQKFLDDFAQGFLDEYAKSQENK